tara:strand:- start:184 stop:609 length:426 start_codon:yes stop_codon:yes gene_type:complete
MKAFYSYSTSLLNDENLLYESNLIDIKPENFYRHILLLKSSKPEVKPLNISIGNSVFADIINCFDQLVASNKVRNIYSMEFKSFKNKRYLKKLDKKNISNILLPPLISLCSIFLVSTVFIYLYDVNDTNDNRALLDTKKGY